ncbi:MAG: hypothetical protein ABS99_01880 [Acetobacteraceae bacterium SCN 69-10]|nr:MAG: hypothetical protein ABS99_01880 [Acetobacteraceae bacterium SCN 69-10]OJY70527.1 MAG: hypothetical protein BGP12_22700 [Rhodospirillales bacterium 70-18]
MTRWDGTERPDAAGLLEIARATLLADIVPKLEGDARFKALMAANAMAIAQRALREGSGAIDAALARLGDPTALCAAIRAGQADNDAETAAALLALAEARCRVSAPKAVG